MSFQRGFTAVVGGTVSKTTCVGPVRKGVLRGLQGLLGSARGVLRGGTFTSASSLAQFTVIFFDFLQIHSEKTVNPPRFD